MYRSIRTSVLSMLIYVSPQVLMDEINIREPKSEQLCEAGRGFVSDKHPRSQEIHAKILSLQQHWKTLHGLAGKFVMWVSH